MEDALEVQTQEYYVTNILTKNNNILWTIFNLSVLLRLFRKENIELIEIKKKKLYLGDLLLRKANEHTWDIFQAVLMNCRQDLVPWNNEFFSKDAGHSLLGVLSV